ncbi:hypothetical protein [Sediminispirochaeta smaragdinae]|jgi:hypothetical protein|uniref:Uncharacterized protein n=1 Tax=Sediminispirochaeta smaragdinae (strain DSM 11293 / JCM 15392 / SEBR 4228) TaxID=573413 RepID=E1RB95_SEDSS|nr:hypothetical protein [Sediminispirochaeta smaragdinae]ADK79625.1 hypothetical protein Spirs_0478 [Sediminispirochaeta smaragdinae DSM 11293]
MEHGSQRLPTVVLPLSEECDRDECQDIFVYLRPESNGILVESTIMKVIGLKAEVANKIKLIYLANLPGEFISKTRVIEKHYRLKLLFTKKGKSLFTPFMKTQFSQHFGISFEDADILGAFDAMRRLKMSREELFGLWVPEKDLLHVNGQTIKRYHDFFIINYDIPAILHKNIEGTDIAVMIFRTELSAAEFHALITDLVTNLRKEGLVDVKRPFSRVFHYSNGPFEQIRDGLGFLYDKNGNHLPLEKLRFYDYLQKKGLDREHILKTLAYPIFVFNGERAPYHEETIYEASFSQSYAQAYQTLASAKAQLLIGKEI